MKNNYKVYAHIFPNGKKYVGLTKQDPAVRWGKEGKGYKGQPFLYNAIYKYGWNNIEHRILFTNLTKEEAEEKEKEFISKWKTTNSAYGYNILNGGGAPGERKKEIELPQIIKTNKYGHGKVVCFESKMVYENASTASRELKINLAGIKNCCRGKQVTAGGLHWYHYDDIKDIL